MQSIIKNISKEINTFHPDISQIITNTQLIKLATFINELIKWNKKANLIGKNNPIDIIHHLIIDSLYLSIFVLKFQEKHKKNVLNFLDIGAGAGIPGVPFRIVYNRGKYTMVEPRKKRAIFVSLMIKRLELDNTLVLMKNIEEVAGTFDVVLSRAFCPWRDFLKLSSNYLIPKGYCIVFSNSIYDNGELEHFSFIEQFSYPTKDKKLRYLWLFEKKAPS